MLTRRTALIGSFAATAGCSSVPGLEWNGFRYFTRGEPSNPTLVVAPVGPTGLTHWLKEETVNGFVAAGFYVVGAHWPGRLRTEEDYGSGFQNIAGWLEFMRLDRPLLYAHSRGGLQLLNFACDHPNSFRKIAALYPVTDPFVYPGRSLKLWAAYAAIESTFPRAQFTPNLRASSLRGRPIKIWHGDSDKLVPKPLTTDIFAAASGAEVVTLRGIGHQRLWLDEIPAYLHS